MSWLSELFKSGPVHKHWWRENHDGSYRIVATIYGDGCIEHNRNIAVVSFDERVPVDKQHAAMARIVKGLDN